MDLSTSAMEMTITNNQKSDGDSLHQKYSKEIAGIKSRNEKLQQEIHEGKSAELFYKNMIKEANCQVDLLQQEIIQAQADKEKLFKDQYSQKLNPLKAQCISLEHEIAELQQNSSNEIIQLKEKLNLLKKSQQDNVGSDKQDIKYNKDELLRENEELKKFIITNRELLEKKTNEETDLVNQFAEQNLMLNEAKEVLEAARYDFNSVSQETKELNEEIAQLETQMKLLTSKPLADGTRGNSLFAQVDDKRISDLQKIKQLKKVYDETVQAVARSSRKLKKLRVGQIMKIEKLKLVVVNKEMMDISLSDKIKKLEAVYLKLEDSVKEVLCAADPNMKDSHVRFVNFTINKPWESLKAARKMLYKQSTNRMKVAEQLHSIETELLSVRKSLLLEESKYQLLLQQLEDYENSEATLTESSEEISEEKNTDDGTNNDDTAPIEAVTTTSIDTKEYPKPTGERRKPQLKFICKQKVVNMSDFDSD